MKRNFLAATVLAVGINLTPAAPPRTAPSTETTKGTELTLRRQVIQETWEAPNEIKGKNVSYSGIAVQIAKTDHPLHLINPNAPPEYGSGQQNFVPHQDPFTGNTGGWKVFAINF